MHAVFFNIHHTQAEVKSFVKENPIIAFLTNSLKLQLEAVDVFLFRTGILIENLCTRENFGIE